MPRFGFTTGSCSAAAAKAATYMLLTGKIKNETYITTPKGVIFHACIVDITRTEDAVSCAVVKDGGDDPDITTGAHICATVSIVSDRERGYGEAVEKVASDAKNTKVSSENRIIIEGGEGVGVVTKPGLDQPVGNAAINSIPRKMIVTEVAEVMDVCDFKGILRVIITVPEGRELAKKTFNPRLGIVDGISILGTSGIVEPMSSEALVATIQTELNQKKALGWEYVPISPGNYGLEFMKREYDFDLDVSVKCSNFVGDTFEMVKNAGFKGVLFTGHIGKLVKIAGGMMNTHSKYGDNRMQVIAECARRCGVGDEIIAQIYDSVATEDAVDILDRVINRELNIRNEVMNMILEGVLINIRNVVGDTIQVDCMMYSNKHGLLAKSDGVERMLEIVKKQI